MVFVSKGDPYKGVSVSASAVDECLTSEYFGERLRSSVMAWRERGRKGVWIQIPATRPELIAVAQAQGFTFHHAEPDYLMMCTWLSEGESMLPANASHSVGVGIVCLDEDGKIVMVQEASGPAAGRKGGFWKVPTGLGACPPPSTALNRPRMSHGSNIAWVAAGGWPRCSTATRPPLDLLLLLARRRGQSTPARSLPTAVCAR